jgi:hypothetical protein
MPSVVDEWMSKQHWQNGTDRRKKNCLKKKNLFHCHQNPTLTCPGSNLRLRSIKPAMPRPPNKAYLFCSNIISNKQKRCRKVENFLDSFTSSSDSFRMLIVFRPHCSNVKWMNPMFVDPCIIVQFIKENPTRCNNVSKFYYSIFIWSSTCFRRHTAHH